jgi:hypothetical protein
MNPEDTRVAPKGLLLVFLVALALRASMLLLVRWDNRVTDSYDVIALNVVHGLGFSYNGRGPTVCRAPAYPLYLALQIRLLGNHLSSYGWLRATDIVIDSLTACIIVLIVSTWFCGADRKLAYAGGLAYGLNPFMAYYAAKLGSETLANLCFAIYCVLLGRALFKKYGQALVLWVFVGISGGLLMLNKSVYLPIVLVMNVAAFACLEECRNARLITRAALAMGVSFLLVLPWTIRNYRVSKELVPIQSLVGFNFWYDFNLDAEKNQMLLSGKTVVDLQAEMPLLDDGTHYNPYTLNAKDDAKYDRQLQLRALRWVREHPGRFAAKVLDNMLSFWYLVEGRNKVLLAGLFSITVLAVCLLGSMRLARERYSALTFVWLTILAFPAIYSPILAVFRYSLGVYPLTSILSAPALVSVMAGKSRTRS